MRMIRITVRSFSNEGRQSVISNTSVYPVSDRITDH